MKLNSIQIGALKTAAVALLTAGVAGQATGYFLGGSFAGLACGLVGCVAGIACVWYLVPRLMK
jgi:hypothetical protein